VQGALQDSYRSPNNKTRFKTERGV